MLKVIPFFYYMFSKYFNLYDKIHNKGKLIDKQLMRRINVIISILSKSRISYYSNSCHLNKSLERNNELQRDKIIYIIQKYDIDKIYIIIGRLNFGDTVTLLDLLFDDRIFLKFKENWK